MIIKQPYEYTHPDGSTTMEERIVLFDGLTVEVVEFDGTRYTTSTLNADWSRWAKWLEITCYEHGEFFEWALS